MKLAALLLFLSVVGSVAASDAAKNHGSGASASCDSAKAAKAAEENAASATAKPDTRSRPNATPRRIPYHMLMIH